MSEWRSDPLGVLADFRKGVKVEIFDAEVPGTAPYLGAYSIDTGESPPQFARERRAILARSSDVLMLWDGERSGLAGGGQAGVVASTVMRLRPRPGVDSSYLRHALQNQFGWIQARRTGTGVPHVPKDLGTWLSLYRPVDRAEQRQVAAVLDVIDAQIRIAAQIVKKLRATKQGLVVELLTRGVDEDGALRPPGASASDTPIGRLPSNGDVTPLSEILASSDPAMRSGPFGSALLKRELVPSGIPLLGIDNVYTDRFVAEYTRFVTPAKARQLARYQVFPGDVMITIMGTVGRACLVPDDVGHALSSKHVWTMTFDSKRYVPYLVSTQLNHAPWALTQLRRDEQGGIMNAIRSETLRSMLLPKPPFEEQERIAQILMAMDERLAVESAKLDQLRLTKLGLARDLLAGRVRVPAGAAS
jgi:type I restriction enzyme S subunit